MDHEHSDPLVHGTEIITKILQFQLHVWIVIIPLTNNVAALCRPFREDVKQILEKCIRRKNVFS